MDYSKKVFFAIVFFVSISSFKLIAQSTQPEIFLTPITSNPSPLLRLEFAKSQDSVLIYGTNLAVMPLGLKKVKIVNPKTKLNFVYSLKTAESSIEANYALQKDTSLKFRSKLTGQSYYNVLKTSFLSGKGNSPIFVNQNIRLGGFIAPPTWPQNFSFNVSGAGEYLVNYLPATNLSQLPVLDESSCTPITESMYKLRQTQGYGLEKILYKPYNARKRETVRKSFDIYFESGSNQPKGDELKSIVNYLDQNKLEILNATMKGGSSVDGDEVMNKRLQRDRARVISSALSRYNKSAIKKDTILLTDNWPEFKAQLKASQYAWLDTLPKENILAKINSDEKLKKSLEPILKTQRKASLNLTMAKVLTADDQFVTLKRTLNAWLKAQSALKVPNKETEQQIMGAIAYLFEQHENGVLSSDEVDSLLDGDYQEQKYLNLGLHIIKEFNDGKFGEEKKENWQNIWESLELHPWIEKAQTSLITLAENATRVDLPKYMKMQVDFQTFLFRMMRLGVIDPQEVCHSIYPDKNEYLAFALYNKAFQYELVNETGVKNECVMSRAQITGLMWSTSIDTTLLQTDSAYINIPADVKRTGIINRNYIRPVSDNSPKDSYYELLEKGFIDGVKGIGSNPMDAFSLFQLTEVNVVKWDPEQNLFYDLDVRIEELDRLITMLKKSNVICPSRLNKLYLDYHVKALRYLELYFEPGSAKHKEIADGSLKFISDYYKARFSKLPENSVLPIAYYLNKHNWFPGGKEGAEYGYDLMKTIAIKRKLTEAELKLFANYLKVFDPELKNPLPALNNKETVSVVMLQPY